MQTRLRMRAVCFGFLLSSTLMAQSNSSTNIENSVEDLPISQEELRDYRHGTYRHIQVGLGYVHSQWSKISPALSNGSMALELGTSRRLGTQLEGGIRALFLNGEGNSVSDQIYAMSLGGQLTYLFSQSRITPFAGASLSFASYRAWSVAEENASSIRYDKHVSGTSLGIAPRAGMRLYLSPRSAVELAASYEFFINDSFAQKVGGPALSLHLLVGSLKPL